MDVDNSLLRQKMMNNKIKNKIKYQKITEKDIEIVADKYFSDYPHMTYFENIDDHLDEVFGLNEVQFTQLIDRYHI